MATGATSQEEAAREEEAAQLAEIAEDAQRVKDEEIARLKKKLKEGNLAICVGAGVTLYTTAQNTKSDGKRDNLQRMTWKGLIRSGLNYLVAYDNLKPNDYPFQMQFGYAALKNNDSSRNLLLAAENMKNLLKEKDIFPTWLESAFRNLHKEKRHFSILDALKRLHENGAILLTTNYDGLIEEHCGLDPIDSSDTDELARFMRREVDGVFHPHGHWKHSATIVMDTVDYYKAKEVTTEVQDALQTFLRYSTVLFVGCGGTLDDPNFGPLLDWIGDKQRRIAHNHCLLLQDDDKNPVDGKPLVPLRCGKEYDDIAPFLEKLLQDEVANTESTSE